MKEEVPANGSVNTRSRFHNLTKLFLNSLFTIYTRGNLIKAGIDESI